MCIEQDSTRDRTIGFCSTKQSKTFLLINTFKQNSTKRSKLLNRLTIKIQIQPDAIEIYSQLETLMQFNFWWWRYIPNFQRRIYSQSEFWWWNILPILNFIGWWSNIHLNFVVTQFFWLNVWIERKVLDLFDVNKLQCWSGVESCSVY